MRGPRELKNFPEFLSPRGSTHGRPNFIGIIGRAETRLRAPKARLTACLGAKKNPKIFKGFRAEDLKIFKFFLEKEIKEA